MQETLHVADRKRQSDANRVTRWIDQVVNVHFHRYCPAEAWAPAINLYEDNAAYYVVADLAGVEADRIDLHVEDGRLVLSGQRAAPRPGELKGALRLQLMEIDHGPFMRAVELPSDVEMDQIGEATYRGGFLWVRMPKRP